jgi:hypothetical protein
MVERWNRNPEKASIARQSVANTFPWQPKHTPASTIPGPSLGNKPLNSSLNNGDILGSSVFCAVCAKAILQGTMGQAHQHHESRLGGQSQQLPVHSLEFHC